MMKKLLFLSLITLMFSIKTNAQARINYSETEIRNDKDFAGYTFEEGYTDKGIRYLMFSNTYRSLIYYFKDGVCASTCVIPNSVAVINGYVEFLNKNYVILNDHTWLNYTSGGILRCDYQVTDGGSVFFAWSIYEQ